MQTAGKYAYNLRQKVKDKLTKLSKKGFSMECFTADFLQFFSKKYQNLTFGWTSGYSPSNPSISRIFGKFPNFLRSEVLSSFFFLVWAHWPPQRLKCRGDVVWQLVRQLVRQLLHLLPGDDNLVPFYLW